MIEPTIACPKCQTEIKLTESLAAPLIEATRVEYEQRISAQADTIRQKEEKLGVERAAIEKAREELDEQVAARLKVEREKISVEEAKKARAAIGSDLDEKAKEITELREVALAREAKLIEAQKAQAELMRKQRELDDAKRELDITIEKRVNESLGAVREKARHDAEQGLKLKLLEKEEQMSAMQRQIEELKRRAEQGSQQLQGEVLELELETTLRARFPFDMVDPVPKGELGADVLQRVANALGQPCGAILWESKRTKNWSDGWLAKLRGDQRIAKAEIAVLVSSALPKGIETFGQVDGIWITEPRYALALVAVLRQTLIEIANTRLAREGQQTKMELVYEYLTGPRFRHRVEAIVEKFSDMQSDLDKERKTMTRLWAKRQTQIDGVIDSTVGMYGDLQGIAGRALQEIEGLEMAMIEDQGMDDEAVA